MGHFLSTFLLSSGWIIVFFCSVSLIPKVSNGFPYASLFLTIIGMIVWFWIVSVNDLGDKLANWFSSFGMNKRIGKMIRRLKKKHPDFWFLRDGSKIIYGCCYEKNIIEFKMVVNVSEIMQDSVIEDRIDQIIFEYRKKEKERKLLELMKLNDSIPLNY